MYLDVGSAKLKRLKLINAYSKTKSRGRVKTVLYSVHNKRSFKRSLHLITIIDSIVYCTVRAFDRNLFNSHEQRIIRVGFIRCLISIGPIWFGRIRDRHSSVLKLKRKQVSFSELFVSHRKIISYI